MSFFRYALLDLLRGRRRTFSSILGILLAITFLSGTFIAIDSSARATLEGLLAQVNGDFGVYGASGDPVALQDTLLAHPGVRNASVYFDVYLDRVYGEDEQRAVGARLQAVDPSRLPRSLEEAQVTGSLALPRGTVALSQTMATALNVRLNQSVTVQLQTGWDDEKQEPVFESVNLTVTALVTVPESSFYTGFFPEEFFALIHLRDLAWFLEQLSPLAGHGDIRAEVWVDRDRFIDPYDLAGSQRNLVRFQRDLQRALQPYGAQVTDNLSGALNAYTSQASIQRVVYLLFSLPVLLLGLYLGAVGVDLGHAERRRELAVLRTRGAGRGQVVGLLLLMAVLGGVLATVVGLAAGVALSRVLLVVVNPFALTAVPTYGDIVLSVDTVIIVALFSVVFMLLASYRSARRTAGLPVAETLRHYAPGETRIGYKPTLDIVLLGLGTLTLLGVWYVRFSPGSFLIFLLGVVFVAMLPIAPILIIVGGTRLLTRSTGKIYEWAARLWKPLAGSLYHIISRNLRRNPRRSANVAIIIALGLAFGMFIFAFLGTTQGYQERIVRAQLGADVAVFGPPVGDLTFTDNVTKLDQVAGVTKVQQVPGRLFGSFLDVFAVDSETLFDVTKPEPWYFDSLSPAGAAAVLRQPGHILASTRTAETFFLEVDDRVTLTGTVFNETSGFDESFELEVTVGGIVRALPGTVRGAFSLPAAVYASFDTLGPLLAAPPEEPRFGFGEDRVLVDLHPGADWGAAKEAILGLGASNVQVTEEQLIQQRSDPFFRSILGFIGMEIAFLAVILTAGLGLILFTATLEREVEFAAIRARGASGWQAAGLLVGEAFSIMLVGLAFGVGVGLLVAYFLIQLFILAPAGVGQPLVPLLFQVPVEGFLLVGLVPLAMLLTALLISWRVARMNVARVLKIRGG
ncbi:MAG: FtsX-like permease family protein [Thermoplasmata archaeon]